MISKGFFENLEKIAEDRSLDIKDVLAKVEIAMAVACRDSERNGDIKLDIDYEKKRIRVYEYKYVVEEIVEGIKGQILLEQARALKPKTKIEVGTVLREEIDFSKLGRKNVSKFKNTFSNELKNLERKEAYDYFKSLEREIITATVINANDKFVTFAMGKDIYASLPMEEAIPGETFEPQIKKKVYISKVEETTKGPKIYISRASKEFVKKLFELNIPEVKDGSVEIMGISRVAGSRSKVGVIATVPNLDPKGTCVGQGGERIRRINDELNGEKIDIFHFKNDPIELISQSLLPARSLSVMIDDPKLKQAVVIVTDEQFSLAIGRGGQNVRLACFATSWKIDIKKLSDALSEGIDFKYNVF